MEQVCSPSPFYPLSSPITDICSGNPECTPCTTDYVTKDFCTLSDHPNGSNYNREQQNPLINDSVPVVGRNTYPTIYNPQQPLSPREGIPFYPHPPNHPRAISGISGIDLQQDVLWATSQPLAAIMGHVVHVPTYAPNWSTGCQGYQVHSGISYLSGNKFQRQESGLNGGRPLLDVPALPIAWASYPPYHWQPSTPSGNNPDDIPGPF